MRTTTLDTASSVSVPDRERVRPSTPTGLLDCAWFVWPRPALARARELALVCTNRRRVVVLLLFVMWLLPGLNSVVRAFVLAGSMWFDEVSLGDESAVSRTVVSDNFREFVRPGNNQFRAHLFNALG